MATKEQKNQKIQEIKESFAKAQVAIVSDPTGLSVEEITNLRRKLQKEGADYTVVKNTLAIKAIEGTEYECMSELLKGASAIAFGFNDQVAPAKVLASFIKEVDKAAFKGGAMDGRALSVEEVKALATLPSKEELYAKMLGCINSPATGIAGCVNGVMSALVRALDAVAKQKQA